jgi:hypothetical protein
MRFLLAAAVIAGAMIIAFDILTHKWRLAWPLLVRGSGSRLELWHGRVFFERAQMGSRGPCLVRISVNVANQPDDPEEFSRRVADAAGAARKGNPTAVVTMPRVTLLPTALENGFGFSRARVAAPSGGFTVVTVPVWFLALPFVAVAGWAVWRRLCRSPREGHCSKCGYDLRASPIQCPECGTSVAAGLAS